MTKVSINIVTWNSLKFLSKALESVRGQTHRDFSVLIIDNGSTDGTVQFAQANFPEVKILRNTRNLGFSRAHNQGIEFVISHWRAANPDGWQDKYILLMNPDVILENNFLEKLIAAADKYPSFASFGGKILRAFLMPERELQDDFKSDIVDSTGLLVAKSRAMKDRGASARDGENLNQEEEVFGISGALVLYRARALEEARFGREYLDEDFFTYKEDIDLAWRLRNLGWGAVYAPAARAYHFRSLGPAAGVSFRELLVNRQARSATANFYSYRNHPAVIFKNDFAINFLTHLPYILFYELAKFFYVCIFEPKLLLAIPSFWFKIPKMFKKRRAIMKAARIKPREIREWFI